MNDTDSDQMGADTSFPTTSPSTSLLPISARLFRFLRETVKLGVALGLAFVILALGVAGMVVVYQRHEQTRSRQAEENRRRTVEPLRKVKAWPTVQGFAQSRVDLQTKWGDGGFLLRLSISEVPAPGLKIRDNAQFILRFADVDGFTVIERAVAADEVTRIVSDKTVAYEWQGSATASPEAYARFDSFTMVWSGVEIAESQSKARPDSADSGWRSLSNWRKLRIGMNPDRVRGLLGDPTYVDAGPWTHWVYGGKSYVSYPHVTFYQGVVEGWKEP